MREGIPEHPSASIIIPSYNGRELLERFIPSIVAQDYYNFEVIIVDNASSDLTDSFIRENYPDIKVVESNKNAGTAEGSNLGLRAATGEYILWLSNDMELEPEFLSRLLRTIESERDIGICTCKMRRITSSGEKLDVIDSVGADLDELAFPSARGINQPDKGQLDKRTEVFFSFGGAMLVKRSVIEEIGAYDPKFFTLADDIDLCWRAHLAGYKVVVEPAAVLYHRVSATLGTVFRRSQKRFMSERNTLRMLIKNYSLATLVRVLPLYFGQLLAESFFLLVTRRMRMVEAYGRALAWNLSNFADTWRLHVAIQKMRTVRDPQIRELMYTGSFKIRIYGDFLRNRRSESWAAYFGRE